MWSYCCCLPSKTRRGALVFITKVNMGVPRVFQGRALDLNSSSDGDHRNESRVLTAWKCEACAHARVDSGWRRNWLPGIQPWLSVILQDYGATSVESRVVSSDHRNTFSLNFNHDFFASLLGDSSVPLAVRMGLGSGCGSFYLGSFKKMISRSIPGSLMELVMSGV